MELEYAFEPLRLRGRKQNETKPEQNNPWDLVGAVDLEPDNSYANSNTRTPVSKTSSAAPCTLTTVENNAFDELLVQLSTNYEFDVSFVENNPEDNEENADNQLENMESNQEGLDNNPEDVDNNPDELDNNPDELDNNPDELDNNLEDLDMNVEDLDNNPENSDSDFEILGDSGTTTEFNLLNANLVGAGASETDIITEELALSCIIAIPERILPTSHAAFLRKFKERTTRVRSTLTRISKKWDEDEIPEVVKLGGNRILINKKLVHVNYTTFITESDVVINLDPDPDLFDEANLPNLKSFQGQEPGDVSCLKPYCRLGCVCDSIRAEDIERTHCGKPKCFFECGCLFKNQPAISSDDADIRSRLRPRRSLLNWKAFGQSGNDSTDPDFIIKIKPPPILRKQVQTSSTDTSQSLTFNRVKRNIQPPSRLRNEFVMGEGKRNSLSSGRKLKLPLEKPEVKARNFKNTNTNIKGKSEQLTNKTPLIYRSVLKAREKETATNLPCLSPSSSRPVSLLIRKQPSQLQSVKDIKPLKRMKSVFSARYLYNHSILRRMHNCRPCFIRLARVDSIRPSTSWPYYRRPGSQHKQRQVAMKSTAKRSLGFSRTRPRFQNRYPNSHSVQDSKIQIDPLLIMKTREENTYVILRENGTILSFLCWSLRKQCVPTAKKYEPEAGDLGSGSYPWLKLATPPLDQAWIFYELPKNYLSVKYMGLSELQVMLRTQTIADRIRETEIHGITQKLDVGDYMAAARRNTYGSIYIVKNLPTILICGPLRKKKLKPMSIPRQLEAEYFLNFSIREYPDPERLRCKKYPLSEMEVDELSDEDNSIEMDNETRDADLIPPEVMMQHYRSFMIRVPMDSSCAFNQGGERHYDFDYDLDYKFGKERLYSPSDLVMDLEDPHSHTEENTKENSDAKNITKTDDKSSVPLGSKDDVIVIDDDDDDEDDFMDSKSDFDLRVDHVAKRASHLSRDVNKRNADMPVTSSTSSDGSRTSGLSLLPLAGNSKVFLLVAPL